MKQNLFSFFSKKNQNNQETISSSEALNKLQSTCDKNDCKVLQNITLFHHSDKVTVALIVLDPFKRIHIVEHKDWTYNDLNTFKLEKSQNNEPSKDTLAYDKVHTIIHNKFNEILHNQYVTIYNFLLCDKLAENEYDHLQSNTQSLLPKSRIIFADTSSSKISEKLNAVSQIDEPATDINFIMANLLTQYLVLSQKKVYLASDEQRIYIDDTQRKPQTISLNGSTYSGKTTALILKAIYLKLLDCDNSVSIIQTTVLGCDLVKQSILELIEYSILNIDITSIKVFTPSEFLHSKASKFVFCDDSHLIQDELLEKIIKKSSHTTLTLVNTKKECKQNYMLSKSFQKKIKSAFVKLSSDQTLFSFIKKIQKEEEVKSILCVCEQTTKEELFCDFEKTNDQLSILDGTKNLVDQNQHSIFLSDYKTPNTFRFDYIIVYDISKASNEELNTLVNMANEKVFIVYEEECDTLLQLKKRFKD